MSIKLVYFDGRGRGELLRLLLAAAGQEFQDERIQFQDWPQRKQGAKFNVVPNLVYNGKTYGQTLAIGQFLAREFGFYGKGNEEALRVDEALQILVDMQATFFKQAFEENAATKEALVTKAKESYANSLKHLEGIANDNGKTGYFVGSKLSIADIMLFVAWSYVEAVGPNGGSDFKELKKIMANVQSLPSIKNYLAKRKETQF